MKNANLTPEQKDTLLYVKNVCKEMPQRTIELFDNHASWWVELISFFPNSSLTTIDSRLEAVGLPAIGLNFEPASIPMFMDFNIYSPNDLLAKLYSWSCDEVSPYEFLNNELYRKDTYKKFAFKQLDIIVADLVKKIEKYLENYAKFI